MPKDRSHHGYSSHKSGHAYKPYFSHEKGHASFQGSTLNGDDSPLKKDWDDVTCPICMETPHNAVLLRCSSYEKGCRPYMCDTSYRHSNCLDQYCKAHMTAQKVEVGSGLVEAADDVLLSSSGLAFRVSNEQGSPLSSIGGSDRLSFPHSPGAVVVRPPAEVPCLRGSDLLGLLCPLCRGQVKGWEVVVAARQYLNRKSRNCAQESCSFAGFYRELRAHARQDHPAARPTEVDPVRERNWKRMEQQRELADILSTIQSAIPGATFLGDYAVGDQEDHSLLTVFLLFQVFGPAQSSSGGRLLPQLRVVRSQHHGLASTRRQLWGEPLNIEESSPLESSSPERLAPGSSSRRHWRIHRRFHD